MALAAPHGAPAAPRGPGGDHHREPPRAAEPPSRRAGATRGATRADAAGLGAPRPPPPRTDVRLAVALLAGPALALLARAAVLEPAAHAFGGAADPGLGDVRGGGRGLRAPGARRGPDPPARARRRWPVDGRAGGGDARAHRRGQRAGRARAPAVLRLPARRA